jgi:predicted nucleotide-binding protein (sugar kinase/HSP70/actin superfamily)
MPPEKSPLFRKLSYVSIVMADVIDRTTWRVRPYELRRGMTDEFMAEAVSALYGAIEEFGPELQLSKIYGMLEEITATAATFIDPHQPRRPRIGMVGEIYVRSHTDSNQNIVRKIEEYGGEVVNASIAEWINYVTWERTRKIRRQMKLSYASGNWRRLLTLSSQWLGNKLEQSYQLWRQNQVYRVASHHLDIQHDHKIDDIEKKMDGNRIYHFDIGTEAGLSIGAALGYVQEGFNGILNTFPFTCMPSAICSAVLKPMLQEMKVPYLDAPYDGSMPPNRDTALRTFVYQAKQHMDFQTAA